MSKLEFVKYKVTGAFGLSPMGERRKAFVLLNDGEGHALLYHPKDKKSCASIEICEVRFDDLNDEEYWVTAEPDECFVNIESQDTIRMFKAALAQITYGKTKSEIYE